MAVKLTLEGSGQGAVKAVQDLNKAIAKTEKGAQLTAKEMKQLERAAGQVVKANESGLERYNRRVAETAKLVQQGKLSHEQAAKAVERYGGQLERAGKSGERAFGPGMLSNISGIAAGIVSATGVISLFRAEIAATVKAAEAATRIKLDTAGSQREMRRNLLGLAPEERARVEAAASDIASRLKLEESQINLAIGGTISATGDPDRTIKLVETAARFGRGGDIASMAANIGDIQTATGIKNPEEALGLAILGQSNARVTDSAKAIEGIAKVASAYTADNMGGTAQDAVAMFAALTKGSADTTGERSGTAAVTLAKKVNEFFQKAEGFQPADIDTHSERIALLLKDRQLARKFVDNTAFEAGATGAISKLFLEDGDVRQAYATAHAQTASPAARRKAAAEGIAFVSEGKLQNVALTEDTVKSAGQRIGLMVSPTLSSERREEIVEIRRLLTNDFALGNRAGVVARTAFTMDRAEAIGELEFGLNRLGEQNRARGRLGMDPRGEGVKTEAEKLLEDLKGLQEEQLEELRKANGESGRVPVSSGRQE